MFDLFFQARHAHHEEFIDDTREDRDEAQSLKQRITVVARFVQHLPEELDQAQLAIENSLLRRGRQYQLGLRGLSGFESLFQWHLGNHLHKKNCWLRTAEVCATELPLRTLTNENQPTASLPFQQSVFREQRSEA